MMIDNDIFESYLHCKYKAYLKRSGDFGNKSEYEITQSEMRELYKRGALKSAALRIVLDAYFKEIDKKGLAYEPYRKFSPVGLKVLPRTITIAQDKKLREIAEKTGRKISESARKAVQLF